MRAGTITIVLALLLMAAGGGDASSSGQEQPVIRGADGRVSLPVTRHVKVEADNRTTGRITLIGWDQEMIEATARSERGTEIVRWRRERDGADERITLNVAYAEWPEADREEFKSQPDPPQKPPAGQASAPPARTVAPAVRSFFRFFERSENIDLEVKLPRTAEIEVIRVNRSDVVVEGVSSPIFVDGGRSSIRLKQVGAVEVRTSSGPVEVEEASALVDVITASGTISVRQAASDVRVLSISGRIEVRCARGRVNINNTDGAILLGGLGGDVDAVTTAGEIRFAGALRDGGRYYLKSMSGPVEMLLRPTPPGYTVALSSYRGRIETDLPFKTVRDEKNPANTSRRLTGRFGNGRAQITLDSFDGEVKLGRAPAAPNECGR